jgi:hypothetical protein
MWPHFVTAKVIRPLLCDRVALGGAPRRGAMIQIPKELEEQKDKEVCYDSDASPLFHLSPNDF